ncbi:MAG: hypothetical protein U0326_27610 [Polyangiales bacterium]
MDEGMFVADGINASTGAPLFEPQSIEELVAVARGGDSTDDAELLAARRERDENSHFGVAEGIDRGDLAQTGWGVIFPAVKPGTDEEKRQAAIREALSPLLRHRQSQAGANVEKYYRELRGAEGLRPGESIKKFLGRFGVDPGAAADPEHFPYYLLLVGSPSEIPFAFQYQLDVTYAVGRIHFDSLDDYAAYARSVVEAETGALKLSRSLAFFGVRNPDDAATKLSRESLIAPLADVLEKNPRKVAELSGWSFARHYDDKATVSTLGGLLGGAETPSLIFTASHGVGFNRGDARQIPHQGALLCSDWQNPRPFQPITESLYFSGDHIASDAKLHGLIAFNFACYGGGTPQHNEYALKENKKGDRDIAERPFVSGLHRRLLSHPRGGALAAVGHIERAWSDSLPTGAATGNRLGVFRSAMEALMKGLPVGAAMEFFNQRYAYLGTEMSGQMEAVEYASEDAAASLRTELVRMWTAHNDARDYVVTGDPAVRLRLGEPGAVTVRAPIEVRSAVSTASTVTETSKPAEAPAATPFESLEGKGELESKHFGLFGSSTPKEEPAELSADELVEVKTDPFRGFAEKVVGTLGKIVSDATTLEVRTFVSNTSAAMAVPAEGTPMAQLRAWTRIKLDGDIDVCVPQQDGQLDTTLWALHVEMVKQAQTHRAEMIRMLLGAVGGFFKP